MFKLKNKLLKSKITRKIGFIFLSFLLISQYLILLISPAHAASSPWTQTDWVGGDGQTDWSDTTKYSASSNADDSTTGELTLSIDPYTDRVNSYSPIAYWPLNEASGGTAEDISGNNFDGSYTGVDLGQTGIGDGNTAPYFDGSNDFLNVWSTGFRDRFALTNHNGGDPVSEGTMMIWVKVFNVGVWTDDVNRKLFYFRVDADNQFWIYKATDDNRITWKYEAGDVQLTDNHNGLSDTGFLHYGITWSKTADEVKLYYEGSQEGVTKTGLGVWAGNLADNSAIIGAANPSPSGLWHGYLAHAAVWDTPLTPDQIADLAVVEKYESSGTVTSSIFDSGQGSNWGTLTYNAITPANTSVSVKVRSSDNSDMSGATAFGSCSAISSGTDVSSNDCVTDTERYVQYQVALSTTDTGARPTFEDVSLNFEVSDATAPSISLTPLSPDPNSDSTPSVTGTVTDVSGTVSNVQYQIDVTSGAWSGCSADDGTFDEATEAFTCTVVNKLGDGEHTIYVRATDSNGNTTAGGSESSDIFTIDTVEGNVAAPSCNDSAPVGIPVINSANVQTPFSVTLNYTNSNKDNVEYYALEYGTTLGNYQYGSTNIGGANDISYTVYLLDFNKAYYFRIRTGNGCAVGTWSQVFTISTNTVPTPIQDGLDLFSDDFEDIGIEEVESPDVTPSDTKAMDGEEEKILSKNITIHVIDENKDPVNNAKVTISSKPQTRYTDENGKAIFEDILPGEHTLAIEYKGYAGEQPLMVSDDGKEESDLTVDIQTISVLKNPKIMATYIGLILIIIFLVIKSIRSKKKLKKVNV